MAEFSKWSKKLFNILGKNIRTIFSQNSEELKRWKVLKENIKLLHKKTITLRNRISAHPFTDKEGKILTQSQLIQIWWNVTPKESFEIDKILLEKSKNILREIEYFIKYI